MLRLHHLSVASRSGLLKSGKGLLAAGSFVPLREPLREPACRPSRVADVQGCPRGVWASLQYWRADWPLGSSLVPLRGPQAWATLSSPARRAQGGLLDGAPEAPKGPGGQFSARADDMIIHMRCFGTRQASAKPLPATPPLLPFELGPTPLTPVARRLAGLPVDGFSTRSTRRRRSRPSSSWADAGAARKDAGGRLFYVPFACGPGPLYARKWPAAGGIVAVSRAFCVLRCVVCPFMNPSEGADVVKIVCSGVSNLPISDPTHCACAFPRAYLCVWRQTTSSRFGPSRLERLASSRAGSSQLRCALTRTGSSQLQARGKSTRLPEPVRVNARLS